MEKQQAAKIRYGENFGNNISKAKARRKDGEIRYRNQNQDSTRTGTGRTQKSEARKAIERTGNQASCNKV